MAGSVVRRCWCKDPATGKRWPQGACPKLRSPKHGKWYYRYEAPPGQGETRRRPWGGPFETKKTAEAELLQEMARNGGGGTPADRNQKVTAWLDDVLAAKLHVKLRTLETDTEAFELYWKPALGHMRRHEVQKRDVEEVLRAMLQVNRPLPEGQKPSEMLRRMLAVRADDERRVLAPGEKRHKKSTRPLSASRIIRMYAPFRAACKDSVPAVYTVSPCQGVKPPRTVRPLPLAWTPAREKAFRGKLAKRQKAAVAHLTAVEEQKLWAARDLRPSKVMVWLPGHAGTFLECIAGERLFALFVLTMFCGLRRAEVVGLDWEDIDLDEGVVTIRKTGGDDDDADDDDPDGDFEDDDPKSGHGTRPVPLPPVVIRALRAWKKVQAAEQLRMGAAWPDTGRVFTAPDGGPVTGQWISRRFETLAFRSGLPPVRFHDLRHGAASLLKANRVDTKIISAILGHSRTSFTDATYVLVFPDVAKAAMTSAAAIVPGAAGEGQ